MLKTNRNWGWIDRTYEVTSWVTIARWNMVAFSSGKLILATSGTPDWVAMQDWKGGDKINVALNLPGVEWEVDVKSSDLASVVPWTQMLINDKDSLKIVGAQETAIFKVTEVIGGKVYGYFL